MDDASASEAIKVVIYGYAYMYIFEIIAHGPHRGRHPPARSVDDTTTSALYMRHSKGAEFSNIEATTFVFVQTIQWSVRVELAERCQSR